MKRILILAFAIGFITILSAGIFVSSNNSIVSSNSESIDLNTSINTNQQQKHKPCGKFQGKNIYKGEKGGCYYLKTKKKVRVYIDKKHCKC